MRLPGFHEVSGQETAAPQPEEEVEPIAAGERRGRDRSPRGVRERVREHPFDVAQRRDDHEVDVTRAAGRPEIWPIDLCSALTEESDGVGDPGDGRRQSPGEPMHDRVQQMVPDGQRARRDSSKLERLRGLPEAVFSRAPLVVGEHVPMQIERAAVALPECRRRATAQLALEGLEVQGPAVPAQDARGLRRLRILGPGCRRRPSSAPPSMDTPAAEAPVPSAPTFGRRCRPARRWPAWFEPREDDSLSMTADRRRPAGRTRGTSHERTSSSRRSAAAVETLPRRCHPIDGPRSSVPTPGARVAGRRARHATAARVMALATPAMESAAPRPDSIVVADCRTKRVCLPVRPRGAVL